MQYANTYPKCNEQRSCLKRTACAYIKLVGCSVRGGSMRKKTVAPAMPATGTGTANAFADYTGSCPTPMWADPCDDARYAFQLRGETYLTDKKKVEVSGSMYELVAVDLLEFDQPTSHICDYDASAFQKRSTDDPVWARGSGVPGTICVVWQFPGPPFLVLTANFEARAEAPEQHEIELLKAFAAGDDTDRDNRFKMIPRAAEECSWVVRHHHIQSTIGVVEQSYCIAL